MVPNEAINFSSHRNVHLQRRSTFWELFQSTDVDIKNGNDEIIAISDNDTTEKGNGDPVKHLVRNQTDHERNRVNGLQLLKSKAERINDTPGIIADHNKIMVGRGMIDACEKVNAISTNFTKSNDISEILESIDNSNDDNGSELVYESSAYQTDGNTKGVDTKNMIYFIEFDHKIKSSNDDEPNEDDVVKII